MGVIVNIETSGTNCSVSVSNNGTVIALKEENTGNFSHAEKLHVFIKELLEEANVSFSMVDAVAVSKGPGSYTGLRIGVSAAKGLCFAWDKPLIAISTLEALALQAEGVDADYRVPLLDARRMEVYSCVFTAAMKEERGIEAEIIDATSFASILEKGKVVFLGDGAAKCKGVIEHPNAFFLGDKFPSAQQMAIIANAKFVNQQFEDVAYFEPFYLKDFIAGKKS